MDGWILKAGLVVYLFLVADFLPKCLLVCFSLVLGTLSVKDGGGVFLPSLFNNN